MENLFSTGKIVEFGEYFVRKEVTILVGKNVTRLLLGEENRNDL